MLIDVASKGGNFLLNVGPNARGDLPPVQLKCLQGLAAWMEINSVGIHDTEPVPPDVAFPVGEGSSPSSAPWVRWNRRRDDLFGFFAGVGDLQLPVNHQKVDVTSGRLLGGEKVVVGTDGVVCLDNIRSSDSPVCLRFKLRT